MRTIGISLIVLALLCYASTIQAIRNLVQDSRRFKPERQFSSLWWLPAWGVHRAGFPASKVRRQIVTRFCLTFAFMIAGMACIGVSILSHIPGSRYSDVVWHKEVQSPDGVWMAIAETHQVGGFGSAWVETTVSLKNLNRTVLQSEPYAVLSYPGDGSIRRAYTLSQDNADTKLEIKWLDAGHLDIGYKGDTEPDLEVVKYGGVAIQLRVDHFVVAE